MVTKKLWNDCKKRPYDICYVKFYYASEYGYRYKSVISEFGAYWTVEATFEDDELVVTMHYKDGRKECHKMKREDVISIQFRKK